MPSLRRLLTALRSEKSMTLGEVFDLARQDGYTGEITVHLAQGKPKKVEVPAPVQCAVIDHPLDKPP